MRSEGILHQGQPDEGGRSERPKTDAEVLVGGRWVPSEPYPLYVTRLGLMLDRLIGWLRRPDRPTAVVTALCRAGNHAPCPGRCVTPGHEWTCGCECHEQTRWGWCFEWKLADLWLGVFWKQTLTTPTLGTRTDWWICVIPCVPLHIWRVKR